MCKFYLSFLSELCKYVYCSSFYNVFFGHGKLFWHLRFDKRNHHMSIFQEKAWITHESIMSIWTYLACFLSPLFKRGSFFWGTIIGLFVEYPPVSNSSVSGGGWIVCRMFWLWQPLLTLDIWSAIQPISFCKKKLG